MSCCRSRARARTELKTAERSEAAATASMRPFFQPRSVVVIGANRERGRIGPEVLHNIIAGGFTGTIGAVHPTATQIDGVPAYPIGARRSGRRRSGDHLRAGRPACSRSWTTASRKRVGRMVVISAGFGESGAGGPRPRRRPCSTRSAAPASGWWARTAWASSTPTPDDPAQCDVRACRAARRAAWRCPRRAARSDSRFSTTRASCNIGLSTFVSVGNKTDVSSNDLLQYWASDPTNRGHPAVSRELREPAQVQPDRAAGGAPQADRRRQVGTIGSRRPRRQFAHRRAGFAGRDRGRAVPSGRRHPHRHTRGVVRRRDAAGPPAGAARAACRHHHQRRGPGHPRGRRVCRAWPGTAAAFRRVDCRVEVVPAAGGVGRQSGGHDRVGERRALRARGRDAPARRAHRQPARDLHPAARDESRGRGQRRSARGGRASGQDHRRDLHVGERRARVAGADSVLQVPRGRRSRAGARDGARRVAGDARGPSPVVHGSRSVSGAGGRGRLARPRRRMADAGREPRRCCQPAGVAVAGGEVADTETAAVAIAERIGFPGRA